MLLVLIILTIIATLFSLVAWRAPHLISRNRRERHEGYLPFLIVFTSVLLMSLFFKSTAYDGIGEEYIKNDKEKIIKEEGYYNDSLKDIETYQKDFLPSISGRFLKTIGFSELTDKLSEKELEKYRLKDSLGQTVARFESSSDKEKARNDFRNRMIELDQEISQIKENIATTALREFDNYTEKSSERNDLEKVKTQIKEKELSLILKAKEIEAKKGKLLEKELEAKTFYQIYIPYAFSLWLMLNLSFIASVGFHKRRVNRRLAKLNLSKIYEKVSQDSNKAMLYTLDNEALIFNDREELFFTWKMEDDKRLVFCLEKEIKVTLSKDNKVLQEKTISYDEFLKEYKILSEKFEDINQKIENDSSEKTREAKIEDLISLTLREEKLKNAKKALAHFPEAEELFADLEKRTKIKEKLAR